MTEFIIVLPVLIILILGGFQISLLYHAKTTLNYAAFLAARSGAVANAHVGIMENALARGMAPLYTHCNEAEEVTRARDHVRSEIEAGFGQIEIINPPPGAFSDFGSRVGTDTVIPNDSLMFRKSTTGTSGLSIQDANLLKIRVGYCYPMYVPFIDRLLFRIMTLPADPDDCVGCKNLYPDGHGSFERGCLENNRFPLNAQAMVRMQSDISESATNSGRYPGPAVPNTTFGFVASSCPP
jgi:TadE-like protein